MPLDGSVNRDMSAFGFPPYLGLQQQVTPTWLMMEKMAQRNVIVVDVHKD